MSVQKDNINVEPDSSNNKFNNNMHPKPDEDLSESLPVQRYVIEVNMGDCKLDDEPSKPPLCKPDYDLPKPPPCKPDDDAQKPPPCKPDKDPPKSPHCKHDDDLPKPPPCKPDDDAPKPPPCKPDKDPRKSPYGKPDYDLPKPPPCKPDDDAPKPPPCKPDDDPPKPPPCKPDKEPPKSPPPDEGPKHPYNGPSRIPKVNINFLIVILLIVAGLVCGIEGFSLDFRVYNDKNDNETTAIETTTTETTVCEEKSDEDYQGHLTKHEEAADVEEVSDSHATIKIGEVRLIDTDKTYGMKYEQGYLYIYAIPAEIFEYYGEDEDEFTEGLEYDIYKCLPESINSYRNVELIAEKVQNQFYTISSWEYPQELRLEIITL